MLLSYLFLCLCKKGTESQLGAGWAACREKTEVYGEESCGSSPLLLGCLGVQTEHQGTLNTFKFSLNMKLAKVQQESVLGCAEFPRERLEHLN